MTAPPRLTDRPALDRQRARALRAAQPVLAELHGALRDEVQSRLAEVNRAFTRPAIVTGQPALWADALPGARVVPDAEVLDLTPGAHDLVVHAMALHWADDPLGQIIQSARALVPDGLFLAVFPGGRSLQELRASLATAESELTGGLAPRILPMTDLRDAGALLQRAGLALPVADVQTQPLAYGSLPRLAADLRGTGERNALANRDRRALPRAVWRRAGALHADAFGDGQGRLAVTLDLVWLTGWAPADSQPRALKPGSAAMRLAQALGTAETPLPDPATTRSV